MGAALAINLDRAGHAITLCATEFDGPFIEAIEKTGIHPSLDHALSNSIRISEFSDWGAALEVTDVAVIAVSSTGLRSTFGTVTAALSSHAPVLIATKGWDPETGQPLSNILAADAKGRSIAWLVGPTLAEETASGRPTALVCASETIDTAKELADALSSPVLRIFVTSDVTGVEIGAALKNVIAVAVGMCDGLAEASGATFTNAKAALFSQGLVEMTRLSRALGGRDETVIGLTGSGDLFVTVMGGRNARFGRLVGAGVDPKEALDHMSTTVEGYEGCARALKLAKDLDLDLPLVRFVHSVVHEGADPSVALVSFFATWTKAEI